MNRVEYMVDLGGHPPYHPPPEGFHVPPQATGGTEGAASVAAANGVTGFNNCSDSGSDADSSMTSSTTTATAAAVDGNKNFT